ncbi:MAG: insulinase family protein [Phycisphaerales bacterium]|nr:insulinase family protein [Phycisphaerales bacterium]
MITLARISLLATLLAALGTPGAARAADDHAPVVLDNGLRVVLLPMAEARSVALVTLYDIGEWDDPVGQSGLSHLTEHMIATASAGEEWPARSAQAWMQAYPPPLGTNAQTGEDYTVVATVFRPVALRDEIAEAAARMSTIAVTEADMERELPRLAGELDNMYGGMVGLGTMNTIRATVRRMADGQRKGGVMDHLHTLAATDVQRHFDRYYKPRHAMLVLAGKFEREDALALIRTHFAPIPAGEPLPPRPERAPSLLGVTLNAEMTSAFPGAAPPYAVTLGFSAPSPDSPHYPAFLVMAADLFQSSIRAGSHRSGMSPPVVFAPLDDPGLIVFNGAGADVGEANAALQEIRERIRAAVPAKGEMVNTFAATRMFGPMLGLMEMPDSQAAQNPYFIAFSEGRRRQVGLDPLALKDALARLTPADLEACYNAVLSPARGSAVIVRTVAAEE